MALAPYERNNTYYEISNINLGNNSISLLEVVSSLNSFNLAYLQYHYSSSNCSKNYNPKVYFGTIQTVAINWYYDVQTAAIQWNHDEQDPKKVDPKWVSTGEDKSGSWPSRLNFIQSSTDET